MTKACVMTIDDDNFDAEVLGSTEPFLLDFTAKWCGPCRMLTPIVERVAEENVGTLRVGTVDIDESPGVSARLGIRAAPTLVVFKDGKVSARHLGVTTKEKILRLVNG